MDQMELFNKNNQYLDFIKRIPGFPVIPFIFPMALGITALAFMLYYTDKSSDDIGEIKDCIREMRDILNEVKEILRDIRPGPGL